MTKLMNYTPPVAGGVYEHDFCKMSLAKRYNDQTKLVGKQVTRKKVQEVPFFMGC